MKFSYIVHDQVKRLLVRAISFDSAELVYRPSGWWLHVALTVHPPKVEPAGSVIGVDLGINRPAVTSEAQFLGKRRWKEVNQRYFRLNRALQAKGTKSAKRHLKKIARRRKLFRRDCDHVLSKRIVQSVEPGSVIVVEDLQNLHHTTRQRGTKNRRRLHDWSYAQLRTFLSYKSEDKGCQVVAVDPRHTSLDYARQVILRHRNAVLSRG
jgi:putative transposase